MVEVNMPMPSSCAQCPCVTHTLMGYFCNIKFQIGAEAKKPVWCPMIQRDEDDLK